MREIPQLVVFLAESKTWVLTAALDEVAEQFQLTNADPVEWYFPDNEHWRVVIRHDEKAWEDCSGVEKVLLRSIIGDAPPVTLRLILNSRAINQACDAAKSLVIHLLTKFQGVADDCFGEGSIWTLEQIRDKKGGIGFLDCYRRS